MTLLRYNKEIVRVRLLQALLEETMSAVRVNGGLTDWFKTAVGVALKECVRMYHLYFSTFCWK